MFPYKQATIDCGFAFVYNIEPKDYIYSVACEVWLWVSDMMFLWWFSKTHNQTTRATL